MGRYSKDWLMIISYYLILKKLNVPIIFSPTVVKQPNNLISKFHKSQCNKENNCNCQFIQKLIKITWNITRSV